MLDAIVIGGGIAGLSAGSWLARYRRQVLVLDSGRYRNLGVRHAHGYAGLERCDPAELLERARDAFLQYEGASIRGGSVGAVAREGDEFTVTFDGRPLTSRRLVLATGVRDEFPDVAGIEAHYGADVFTCPACDGYEARGRDVVVFGAHTEVLAFARTLLNWAATVTVVTDARPLENAGAQRNQAARDGIRILEDDALELVGDRGDLRGVRLRDHGTIPCRMAFFTIAQHPVTAEARALGCALDDDGFIIVDGEQRTSVEGVFAAGDVTPGMQLLQVAAAEGAVAGIACARSLAE